MDLIEHIKFELNDARENKEKQTNVLSFYNKIFYCICKIYIFFNMASILVVIIIHTDNFEKIGLIRDLKVAFKL